jgi:hypothetical protein
MSHAGRSVHAVQEKGKAVWKLSRFYQSRSKAENHATFFCIFEAAPVQCSGRKAMESGGHRHHERFVRGYHATRKTFSTFSQKRRVIIALRTTSILNVTKTSRQTAVPTGEAGFE